ncbi:MAG: DNA polymerase Y family protein [Candidatus Rokuibacteriota bacterium]
MRNPSPSRYACCWVPRFAAAALVRSDPALRTRPVAVLVGMPATRTVCEVTAEAWARGVRPGMSASEAVTRAPDLVGRERDLEAEGSAIGALLDVALATSPRLEVMGPDCLCLDLAGLGPLFGDEPRLGERLRLGAASLEVPARVGVAGTRTIATLAARTTSGVTVVPPGQERVFLTPRPVGLLEPEPDLAECLERWGIRTLGELAALPAAGVVARLGPRGARLQAQARGEDLRPFVVYVPAEPCVEALALDWEVASLAALAFALRRLLDRLCARLEVRDLGARALYLTIGLADGGAHTRRLELGTPLRDPRTLLGLLRADLERLALPAPIVALRLEAETVPLEALQADLFAPPRPSPRELAETLGRLAILVGPDRIGAPVVGDTHRSAAAGVVPFVRPLAEPIGRKAAVAALAFADAATLPCRRFSPPLPVAVERREGQPIRVEAERLRGAVVACAGPWRTAGEWWADTAWAREEWDVALPDGAVYRLALDRATGTWSVDAVYD